MYSDQPEGVAGNDDGGTIGSWYVLSRRSALYPVAGQRSVDPRHAAVPEGARSTSAATSCMIETEGSARRSRHVELDGVPISGPYVSQSQLATASTLTFVLGS